MSKKHQPAQLETPTTHNGKNHTKLVEKIRNAKHDPEAVDRAKAARKSATNDPK